MRPVSTSVIFGSRKPLNRSHNPGTLGAAPSGIDCIVLRRQTRALVQPPRGRSDVVLLGHETARPADSPHGAMSHTSTACRVALLDASSPREVSDMGGRTRRQRTMRLMIDGSIYGPAWRQSI
jgi:hypothetical protein